MMQAYKNSSLYNKYVGQEASEAFHGGSISAESYEKIVQAHPFDLYTPNYFIRIALGLLTIVAVAFSSLLLWLISGISGDNVAVVLLVLNALICYMALELFVRSKQYYNAGIDNVLMGCVVINILSAFLFNDYANSDIITSGCISLLCLWLCIRFIDAFMAMLCYCSLLLLIFFICMKMGDLATTIIPFIVMITSAIVYFITKRLLNKQDSLFYDFCLKFILFLTLITFYASGNYFIVKELSDKIFPDSTGNSIPLNWFFWIFTIIIPPAYLFWGILKKNILFIRTGIGLVAATIFTIRYYYTFFPGEIEMLVIGMLVIATSYILIKYLRTPQHGFSFEKGTYDKNDLRNAEALIIAQAFGKKQVESKGFEFGGGSSGGGGATGNY
jgi:uncharacterized membrane protein YgcG